MKRLFADFSLDVAMLMGLVLIGVGIYHVNPPAVFLYAGAIAIILGVLLARARVQRSVDEAARLLAAEDDDEGVVADSALPALAAQHEAEGLVRRVHDAIVAGGRKHGRQP